MDELKYPQKPYDPRLAAEYLLSYGRKNDINITHLVLHKLLYFAHGLSLTFHKRPLIFGFFEAWRYGPVHPLLYESYKHAGNNPLTVPATRAPVLSVDIMEWDRISADKQADLCINKSVSNLGGLPTTKVVAFSHAPGSPWAIAERNGRKRPIFGYRITNKLIAERFHFHMLDLNKEVNFYEPEEDIRFTED